MNNNVEIINYKDTKNYEFFDTYIYLHELDELQIIKDFNILWSRINKDIFGSDVNNKIPPFVLYLEHIRGRIYVNVIINKKKSMKFIIKDIAYRLSHKNLNNGSKFNIQYSSILAAKKRKDDRLYSYIINLNQTSLLNVQKEEIPC